MRQNKSPVCDRCGQLKPWYINKHRRALGLSFQRACCCQEEESVCCANGPLFSSQATATVTISGATNTGIICECGLISGTHVLTTCQHSGAICSGFTGQIGTCEELGTGGCCSDSGALWLQLDLDGSGASNTVLTSHSGSDNTPACLQGQPACSKLNASSGCDNLGGGAEGLTNGDWCSGTVGPYGVGNWNSLGGYCFDGTMVSFSYTTNDPDPCCFDGPGGPRIKGEQDCANQECLGI